ncbi:MAG: hypothetical protein MHMPM18_000306 [Marteilia pararefringens]
MHKSIPHLKFLLKVSCSNNCVKEMAQYYTDLRQAVDQCKAGSVSVISVASPDSPDLSILSVELTLLDTYMAKFPKHCANALPTTFTLEFLNPIVALDSSKQERLNLKLTYLTSVNDKALKKTVRIGNIYTVGREGDETRILNDISISELRLTNNKNLDDFKASGTLQLKTT